MFCGGILWSSLPERHPPEEKYVAARPDVFFTGRDDSLRSNRALCQRAGQYAIDAFVGSTLQMDGDANSSTVTKERIAASGFSSLEHSSLMPVHERRLWPKDT